LRFARNVFCCRIPVSVCEQLQEHDIVYRRQDRSKGGRVPIWNVMLQCGTMQSLRGGYSVLGSIGRWKGERKWEKYC
jgi:hypothetical protein